LLTYFHSILIESNGLRDINLQRQIRQLVKLFAFASHLSAISQHKPDFFGRQLIDCTIASGVYSNRPVGLVESAYAYVLIEP